MFNIGCQKKIEHEIRLVPQLFWLSNYDLQSDDRGKEITMFT